MSKYSMWAGIQYPIIGFCFVGTLGTILVGQGIGEDRAVAAYQSSIRTIDATVEGLRTFDVSQYHRGGLFVDGHEEVKPVLLIDAESQGRQYKLLILGTHPLARGDTVRFQFAPSLIDPYSLEARAAQSVKVDGFVTTYDIRNRLQ